MTGLTLCPLFTLEYCRLVVIGCRRNFACSFSFHAIPRISEAEHPEAPAHTKMTAAEVAELQQATQATSAALIDALVAKGKYNWQAFGAGDAVNGGVSKSNCVSWMRNYCQPAMQASPMFVGFDPANANQSIAGFLVARPPYAYIGFGWESGAWRDFIEAEGALRRSSLRMSA